MILEYTDVTITFDGKTLHGVESFYYQGGRRRPVTVVDPNEPYPGARRDVGEPLQAYPFPAAQPSRKLPHQPDPPAPAVAPPVNRKARRAAESRRRQRNGRS